MKGKIKMIGMDLDGTLLTSQKELTAYTRDVLRRAVEQGIVALPATVCGYGQRRKGSGFPLRRNLV